METERPAWKHAKPEWPGFLTAGGVLTQAEHSDDLREMTLEPRMVCRRFSAAQAADHSDWGISHPEILVIFSDAIKTAYHSLDVSLVEIVDVPEEPSGISDQEWAELESIVEMRSKEPHSRARAVYSHSDTRAPASNEINVDDLSYEGNTMRRRSAR